MEYWDGIKLSEFIKQKIKLSESETRNIMR